MKVKQLKLEGFRGFEQLTLKFNPDAPTVIIGENGVGKSTVLDSLVMLFYWFFNQVNPPLENITSSTIKGKYSGFDIKSQCETSQQSIIVLNENISISWKLEISWMQDTVISTKKFSDPCQIKELTHSSQLYELISRLQLESQEKEDPPLPIIIYYAVNRYTNDIPLDIPDNYSFKVIDAYEDALKKNTVNFQPFFRWFRAREDLENEQMRDDNTYKDKQLEAVRNAAYSFIPEFTKIRVRRLPLRMTVTKNGQELIIDQLSDGEKCLLAMVGDIARRLAIANPNLDNPLEGEGIVLIDEIELHLHPKWQQNIIPQLTKTFPNLQFIVTTHSPIVLSYVQPENIYLLKHSDNGIIATHPQTSYGRDIVEIVEDIMGIPSRPSFIQTQIDELFQLIAKGDLENAKKLKEDIGRRINGENDPSLVEASSSIKLKEILNY